MKKLIMLPTESATRLFLNKGLDKLTYYHKPQKAGEIYRFEAENQHLCIVSDEEITEKDLPCFVIYNNTVQIIDMVNVLKEVNKECSGKIISSTDDSLKLPHRLGLGVC